jgi:hypothetical protein
MCAIVEEICSLIWWKHAVHPSISHNNHPALSMILYRAPKAVAQAKPGQGYAASGVLGQAGPEHHYLHMRFTGNAYDNLHKIH